MNEPEVEVEKPPPGQFRTVCMMCDGLGMARCKICLQTADVCKCSPDCDDCEECNGSGYVWSGTIQ